MYANLKITGWPYCADHKEVPTCKCGENVICHECGFGHGSLPCTCSRQRTHDELLEESLTLHAHIWEALAKV